MDILARHARIALQFSGGRDSLACLYLLRQHLDRMTVYWLNTGDAFPEMLEIIEHARELAPRFVEIRSDRAGIIDQYGMPTDLLPRSSTPIGLATGQSTVRMQDSYSCCARVVMEPMHRRMIEDGITLIIRGQRADDGHKAPIVSGTIEQGIQYYFPIEEWTAEDVTEYLDSAGAPYLRFYDQLDTAPDCMHCSGWWSEGRAAYLRRYHPHAYQRYREALGIICTETAAHIAHFNHEYTETPL